VPLFAPNSPHLTQVDIFTFISIAPSNFAAIAHHERAFVHCADRVGVRHTRRSSLDVRFSLTHYKHLLSSAYSPKHTKPQQAQEILSQNVTAPQKKADSRQLSLQ